MLLTSTPKHLVTFFGDTEDGLFSRFMFYMAPSTHEFKNPFEGSRGKFRDIVSVKAEIVRKVHSQLVQRKETPLFFSLTKQQSQRMQMRFQKLKSEYRDVHTEEMDGVIHRYALIFTRIAMILSIYRSYSPSYKLSELEEDIMCKEVDFKCAWMITTTLLDHSMKVYDFLMQFSRRTNSQTLEDETDKLAAKQQCIELYLQGGLTYRQIAAKVLNNAKLSGTVYRWLTKAGVIKK
jgi:hypothetical protein